MIVFKLKPLTFAGVDAVAVFANAEIADGDVAAAVDADAATCTVLADERGPVSVERHAVGGDRESVGQVIDAGLEADIGADGHGVGRDGVLIYCGWLTHGSAP